MTFSVIPIFHTGETLSTVWKWVFLVYQNRKSCFAWIFICPRQTNAFFSSFSFVKMMKRKKKSYFKMHQQFNPSSTVNSFFSHTIFSVSYLFSWRWGRYVMDFSSLYLSTSKRKQQQQIRDIPGYFPAYFVRINTFMFHLLTFIRIFLSTVLIHIKFLITSIQ